MRPLYLVLALGLAACASSSPPNSPSSALLDGFAETVPAPPVSDTDALFAAALRYALANPDAALVPLVASSRLPMMSGYHVRDGDGWRQIPLTAAALPVGTRHTFVFVSDDETYDLAQARGEFGRVSLTLDTMNADTAVVRVGRRNVFAQPGAARGMRPGFVGGGGARVGQFVRTDSAWVFDQWTGWIGS